MAMATVSSSDESSTAPKDFHLSSSLDSDSRLSPNKQKCPLCRTFKKVFYCKDCVHNGNFSYSTLYTQSYSDAQLHYLELKSKKNDLEAACQPHLDKKQKADEIASRIRQANDRIRYLSLAIDEKKLKLVHNKAKLKDFKTKNEKLSKSLPKYEERVQKLETYVLGKREELDKGKKELKAKQEDVKRLRRIRIRQLVDYIFPIDNVQPRTSSDMDVSEDETTSAITEASNTTYIRDRWILAENPSEFQQSIVAPSLPGSGNYCAYNIWVAQNKDTVPNVNAVTAIEHNAAYSISAALVYTAQLVNVLAFYLDVRLPHKMSFSDFCSTDMNEQQFARRVARLNANILHLCFSQNVDLNNLHPLKTLQNVLHLVETTNEDLGRIGPMEVDVSLAANLEESLASDLQTSEDSESEEGDTFPTEWEAVPHVLCSEATSGPINQQQSMQTMSTQQASSMAGGLVTSAANSIASIWRGFTGR